MPQTCVSKNKIIDWGGSKREAVNNLGGHGKIVVTLILLMFNIKMNHKMYFLVKLKKGIHASSKEDR